MSDLLSVASSVKGKIIYTLYYIIYTNLFVECNIVSTDFTASLWYNKILGFNYNWFEEKVSETEVAFI